MNRPAARAAEATGAVLAALLLFVGWIAFYEAPRPTWVNLSPPTLVRSEYPAFRPVEVEVAWHGYRQRAVAEARWNYVVVDQASGGTMHEAEYRASTHERTEEETGVYARALPPLPPGDYVLTISERTQLYSFWPVWWSHTQAVFLLKFGEE